ncbi:hypothetical protein [Acidocella aminolytica]|uniref:Uncharacterized protein n=2 Tax=Acidocella TaxID=50709 RepID=A0A0D6PHU3_9PROT|nr:hypothetical protein [Acidocella aminolytica]GAN80404.1 hypothetical protein Aam_046_045 [Acidocella aminolytica 101 = DSM 11237]SHF44887.1 hypothetical protein SAMN02746095_03301 [Acidocella aminolytica 101 = DSM 11237]
MARRPPSPVEDAPEPAPGAGTRKAKATNVAMIRVNLPPEIHRKLWQMRIDTRQSIQQIVTDILAEKLAEMDK